MSKKLLTVLAAILVVGMAVPSFAAVENVKVGGDVTVYGIYRNNFDFIDDVVSKDQAHAYQTSLRVYVSAALSDNVSAMVRMINERAWGQNTDGGSDFTLDLGYVKLADLMAPGLNLTVGRQEIQIGEGFVVGSAYNATAAGYNANNALLATDLGLQKAFDAVKVDYALSGLPMSFTGFVSKIDEAYGGTGTQDTTLYGVSMLWKPENWTLEPYYVAQFLSGAPSATDVDMSVVGVRATGGVPAVAGLSWKAEFAKEMGEAFNADLKGWAGYVGGTYKFDTAMAPYITLGYNYYTGWDGTGTDVDAWIPMYPSDTASRIGKIAYAALFPANEGLALGVIPTGLQTIKLGFGMQPTEKIGLTLDIFNLRANEVPAGAPVGKAIGNEIDLGVSYKYTEDVTLGLDLGYFMSSDAIDDTATLLGVSSENAWQAVASLKLAF